MPKLYGFSIDEFVKFKPKPGSAAISFASHNDAKYNEKLYDKLNQIYKQYSAVLHLAIDDIARPTEECHMFTQNNTSLVKDFIKLHQHDNIIIHCNAGVSRTGSIIHYIQQEYPSYVLMTKQKYSYNPLISDLLDVDKDRLNHLFNENKEVMDELKFI